MYKRVLQNFSGLGKKFNSTISSRKDECALLSGLHPNAFIQRSCNYSKGIIQTPEDLQAFLVSNPEMEKKYKIVQLEMDVLRQGGERVPENIKPEEWHEILHIKSVNLRRKFLEHLFVKEVKKNKLIIEKEERRIEKEKRHEEFEKEFRNRDDIIYKLFFNSMFLRFTQGRINEQYHWNMKNAILFGQKLVIDCGYDEYMNLQEYYSCARQLLYAFSTNRQSRDPFDLYFCNANMKGRLMHLINRFIPTVYEPDFPLHITPKSYLDLFDKKDLVYLTPHCREEMNIFDPAVVYIIGGLVDKTSSKPLSLAKAKKEGIRTAKLPLDTYLTWGGGSGKNLTLNQVVDILLDVRDMGWVKALNHVPHRKLAETRLRKLENRARKTIETRDSQESSMEYQYFKRKFGGQK